MNLDTHVEDLTTFIDAEDLHELVIVAHSYGGYPAMSAVPV